ncbi:hypothetical protein [Roseateles sp. LYH14W]|uniref:Uncharacterized protein n=1 Tax=Pelomonas parva TaxID=3299032 RepID=A0ABW7F729_9BURK
MWVLHILAGLSALVLGLSSFDAYQHGRLSLGGAFVGVVAGALMPYGAAVIWALLVVPVGFSGAAIRKLARRAHGGSRPAGADANAQGIWLKAFREDCLIRYCPSSGEWQLDADAGPGRPEPSEAGCGDLRRVGLVTRRTCFVALFVDEGGRLCLHLDGHPFDLSDGLTRVKRRGWIPFIKTFEVWHREQLAFHCHYAWADLNEWPDDEDVDIFLSIAALTNDATRRERLAWFWTQRRAGVPITELVAWEQRPQQG